MSYFHHLHILPSPFSLREISSSNKFQADEILFILQNPTQEAFHVCPSPKHSLPLSLSSFIPPFILSCITYSNHDLRLVGRLAQHSVGYTFECLQHINIGKSLENSLEKLYLPWEKLFCKPLSHKIYICK